MHLDPRVPLLASGIVEPPPLPEDGVSTAEGRRRFADPLLKMRDLEGKAIDEIEDLVRAEAS